MTADLPTWLRTQLDADEETARLANAIDPGPWHEDVGYDDSTNQRQGIHGAGLVYAADNVALWDHEQSCTLSMTAPAAVHVALHDPVRVLADIAAKRAILELHTPIPLDERIFQDVDSFLCAVCTDGSKLYDQQRGVLFTDLTVYPCPTLRHLATAYADRAGYDQGWRP